jgi:hypothetical protein
MGDFATDYLSIAGDSFRQATEDGGAVVMGKGDAAQAAQIAALLAIAQRLDAILNKMEVGGRL